MIRVQLLDTASPFEGRPDISTLRLAAVPRIGELICREGPDGERTVTVRGVFWLVNDAEHDVQLRAW